MNIYNSLILAFSRRGKEFPIFRGSLQNSIVAPGIAGGRALTGFHRAVYTTGPIHSPTATENSSMPILLRHLLPIVVALTLAGCAGGGPSPSVDPAPAAAPAPVAIDLGQLHEKAAQGDARAQFVLALHYLHGRGGAPRRPEVAVRWLQRAAAQNYDDAQLLLAVLYQRGEGVPVDMGRAFRLARAVAERGHRHGMGIVAESYEHGRGVKPDLVQAAVWYRRAAEAGEPLSQTRLGFFYLTGRGVKQDRSQAVHWLERAATQYYPPAFYMLGFLHLEGAGSDPVIAYQWILLGTSVDPRPNLSAVNAKTSLETRLSRADQARARKLVAEWQARYPRPDARAVR